MTSEKLSRFSDRAETVFKALFFVYICLGSSSLFYGRQIITYVMYAAFLLGGCVGLMRLAQWRRFYRMPLLLWALLLWLSHAVSLAANAAYFSKNAAVYLILWMWYFFLLYAQPSDRSGEELLRRFRRLAAVFLAWTTALVLVSLGMLLAGYEMHYRDPANAAYEVAAGFFSGRLWGAFQDPNLGSVMSCLGIGICAYWIAVKKKAALTAALAADMALLLLYMALSDSRTGMVCLGVMCAAGVMCALRPAPGERKRLLVALAAAAAALVCGFFAAKLVQRGYNWIVLAANRPELAVNRGYSMAGDLSNRRLDLWRSGLQLALSRPLTGVSFTGAVPYAAEHLPGLYILTNDLWVFNTFDSEPVNILVAQGFPGLAILAVWALLAGLRFLGGAAPALEARGADFFLLTAVVCVLAVSALFQGTMFYQTTPNAFMFWSAFGALMHILPGRGKAGEANEIGPV